MPHRTALYSQQLSDAEAAFQHSNQSCTPHTQHMPDVPNRGSSDAAVVPVAEQQVKQAVHAAL